MGHSNPVRKTRQWVTCLGPCPVPHKFYGSAGRRVCPKGHILQAKMGVSNREEYPYSVMVERVPGASR